MAEAVGTEDRNGDRAAVDGPTLPCDPNVEIKQAGCVRQGGDYVAFDRYGVLTDLAVEGFAEKDNGGANTMAQRPGRRRRGQRDRT